MKSKLRKLITSVELLSAGQQHPASQSQVQGPKMQKMIEEQTDAIASRAATTAIKVSIIATILYN